MRLVTKIDLNPKEKKDNDKVFGAIWFDHEVVKGELLREPGIDGEIICILADGFFDGASFRYLFSLVGASTVEWIANIQIGARFTLVGSMIGETSSDTGKIIEQP